MNRRLVFLFDSSVEPWYADVEAMRGQLLELQAKGVESQTHDLNQMPHDELEHWKDETYAISWRHHQQIVRHFGAPIVRCFGSLSERVLLPNFGKEVPALLVCQLGERYPIAVYPHGERRGRTQKDFSIEAFLEDLAKTLGE